MVRDSLCMHIFDFQGAFSGWLETAGPGKTRTCRLASCEHGVGGGCGPSMVSTAARVILLFLFQLAGWCLVWFRMHGHTLASFLSGERGVVGFDLR